MATVTAGTVDVYVIRPAAGRADASGWHLLALERAPDTRCPGSWETVHGHIEAGEEPEDAARRELAEEAGLVAERLYCVTVNPFYILRTHQVELAVVFAAFVSPSAEARLGAEHQRAEWLTVDRARERFIWPHERRIVGDIVQLLGTGDAGPVEDVLRVPLPSPSSDRR